MAWAALAVLPGWVLGVALQLQQAALWPMRICALLLLGSAVLGGLAFGWARRWHAVAITMALCAGALAGARLTGVRAAHFADQALPSALESIDMEVSGRVSSLSQRSTDGVRFEFAVDSAGADGQALRVPSLLQLGWYSRAPLSTGPVWRASERWRLTVRRRRPLGNSNPQAFDRERWLWENGIGATGHVCNGPRDPRPVWLGASGWHPIEAARQGGE